MSKWKCPLDHCTTELQRYSQISEHILKDHPEDEKHLYSRVGEFWSALPRLFHQSGKWPTICKIFTANKDRV
jgi:hypothetical protein